MGEGVEFGAKGLLKVLEHPSRSPGLTSRL
jgi:hypothetical protein